MAFDPLDSDDEILREVGRRLTRLRIERELTQKQLAHEAGMSKRTVERAEQGASISLTHWIRLLRVLGTLPSLEAVLPAPVARPVERMARDGQPRQRVRPSTDDDDASVWTWGDEE